MTTLSGTNELESIPTPGNNIQEAVSLPQTIERQEPKLRKRCAEPNTSTGLSFYRGLTCRLREGYKRKQGIKLKPHNVYKKIWKLDLFPEISKEVATEQEERLKQIQGYEENSKKHPYEMFPKPEHQPIIPRFPTENERAEALRQVEETFRTFNRGDLDFLCDFLHGCKQFILPLALDAFPNRDFTSAIGWSPDTTRLEILDEYCNEEAIESNQEAYDQLMEGADKARRAIWDMWESFTNAAADKAMEYLKDLDTSSIVDSNPASFSPYDESPGRAAASLAFPANNYYINEPVDIKILEKLPDSFAMMIPTFKSTGKIGLESEGHRVKNGQTIFPDVKIAIKLPPDTICRLIFQPQAFPHGMMKPTEFGDSTRLCVCIQPKINLRDTRWNKKKRRKMKN
ncbi:hypothetical protein PCANC_07551 [Puccinia coronata f. sp. avenae]|uniref:Tet-like 2OG-Fe(II) oxygenase domain-containing protein n=1 Tax=Puccinia coronata f. sp. avenae TaxID=200324 RepID=A0A2N5VSN5_9BASI|nr:hypothetical protein PCANC_07551 [Puccinia coronata f. sp. avenae]